MVMSGIVANNSERDRATLGAEPMRRGIHERQAEHAETLLRNNDFWGLNRTWHTSFIHDVLDQRSKGHASAVGCKRFLPFGRESMLEPKLRRSLQVKHDAN